MTGTGVLSHRSKSTRVEFFPSIFIPAVQLDFRQVQCTFLFSRKWSWIAVKKGQRQ